MSVKVITCCILIYRPELERSSLARVFFLLFASKCWLITGICYFLLHLTCFFTPVLQKHSKSESQSRSFEFKEMISTFTTQIFAQNNFFSVQLKVNEFLLSCGAMLEFSRLTCGEMKKIMKIHHSDPSSAARIESQNRSFEFKEMISTFTTQIFAQNNFF